MTTQMVWPLPAFTSTASLTPAGRAPYRAAGPVSATSAGPEPASSRARPAAARRRVKAAGTIAAS